MARGVWAGCPSIRRSMSPSGSQADAIGPFSLAGCFSPMKRQKGEGFETRQVDCHWHPLDFGEGPQVILDHGQPACQGVRVALERLQSLLPLQQLAKPSLQVAKPSPHVVVDLGLTIEERPQQPADESAQRNEYPAPQARFRTI